MKPVGFTFRLFVCGALAILSNACQTVQLDRPESFGLETVRDALSDPDTWVPAAAAVAIAVSDTDRDISDWARRETPVFGSTDSASKSSDNLKTASHWLMLVTAGVSAEPGDRLANIAGRELLLQPVEIAIPWLKEAANRERPNGRNRQAFPSGHAGQAYAHATLTRIDLERSRLSPGWKRTVSVTSRALAAGTAWARIEAGEHYPTDVLVSAALSNLVTTLLSELVSVESGRLQVYVGRGIGLSFNLRIADLRR
ncbi:MAG: phosphatase PAP2 family protein [Acidobacteria bacterium]|nr:phosphatase PAP2 family protein [Acidobacteriota bacterium]